MNAFLIQLELKIKWNKIELDKTQLDSPNEHKKSFVLNEREKDVNSRRAAESFILREVKFNVQLEVKWVKLDYIYICSWSSIFYIKIIFLYKYDFLKSLTSVIKKHDIFLILKKNASFQCKSIFFYEQIYAKTSYLGFWTKFFMQNYITIIFLIYKF